MPNIDWRLPRANAFSCVLALLAPIFLFLMAGLANAQATDSFPKFLEGLWPEAQAMGVSRATFDAAFRGVQPDLALPDLVLPGKSDVKGQAEFTKTPAQYLSAPYLATLSEQGKSLQTQHATWLAKIERELGVQRQFVLAIWRRRSVRTNRTTTSSRRLPRRPISAAARTCSAPSSCTR